MKKPLSFLLAIILCSIRVAAAEVRLDYERMTEEELLQIVEELSEKLEEYGYSVTLQQAQEIIPAESVAEVIDKDADIRDEYPISIQYARVTNGKGLSTRKDCTISFKNTSEKVIKRVFFSGVCYNRVDEFCGNVSMQCTGPFESDDLYISHVLADVWKDNTASYIVLTKVRIVYMDDTEIVIDTEDDIKRLYVRVK